MSFIRLLKGFYTILFSCMRKKIYLKRNELTGLPSVDFLMLEKLSNTTDLYFVVY